MSENQRERTTIAWPTTRREEYSYVHDVVARELPGYEVFDADTATPCANGTDGENLSWVSPLLTDIQNLYGGPAARSDASGSGDPGEFVYRAYRAALSTDFAKEEFRTVLFAFYVFQGRAEGHVTGAEL